MDCEETFRRYLIDEGYSETTPSGHPSVVYDYPGRVKRIIEARGITWGTLVQRIDDYVRDYDTGGPFEEEGNRSHRSAINALKRFQEMVHSMGLSPKK